MLAHNIREKCKEKGLTFSELEIRAGISPRNIFRWGDEEDEGKYMPAADKLARVASVLGTTSEDLLRNADGAMKSA